MNFVRSAQMGTSRVDDQYQKVFFPHSLGVIVPFRHWSAPWCHLYCSHEIHSYLIFFSVTYGFEVWTIPRINVEISRQYLYLACDVIWYFDKNTVI